MREPRHFGNFKIDWSQNTVAKAKYVATGWWTDPDYFDWWTYHGFGVWMWQFGGPKETPLTADEVAAAPMNLICTSYANQNC